MIELSTPPIPANPAGQDVQLSRSQLYQGLVWKARYPTLFVAPILDCTVLAEYDNGFLREILHKNPDGRTEILRERIFLDPGNSVRFLRLNGSVLGEIVNIIEMDDDEPTLRFTFTLALADAEHGSTEEARYQREFSKTYINAVTATIDATRRFVTTGEDPTQALAEARAESTIK